jgi:hypothetical protein
MQAFRLGVSGCKAVMMIPLVTCFRIIITLFLFLKNKKSFFDFLYSATIQQQWFFKVQFWKRENLAIMIDFVIYAR